MVLALRSSVVSLVKLSKVHTSKQTGPRRYAELLEFAVHPQGAGRSLFFSYNTDLALTHQRYIQLEGSSEPQWMRADPRFFFNRHLVRPFTGGPSSHMALN